MANMVPGGMNPGTGTSESNEGQTTWSYAGPAHLAAAVPYRTHVEAAVAAQRLLATTANEVLDAEGAVARARMRMGGVVPTTLHNTAGWVRGRMEALRAFAESHPAEVHFPNIRAQAVEISESASALRALAERTHA